MDWPDWTVSPSFFVGLFSHPPCWKQVERILYPEDFWSFEVHVMLGITRRAEWEESLVKLRLNGRGFILEISFI